MSERTEEEFREIAHSGGTIRFLREGGVITNTEFSHSSAWPSGLFQVCVSLNGQLLDTVPVTGIGPLPPYPQPSIVAWVISDREGLFGRLCPQCESYFRTDFTGRRIVCPYCTRAAHNVHFTTMNQARFIEQYCKAYLKVAQGDSTEDIIDLDRIATELPENRPAWHYAEEKQQRLCDCAHCETKFDILGEYGSCPQCGRRNWDAVFQEKCKELRADFHRVKESLPVGREREREWGKLVVAGVSVIDGVGTDIKSVLLRCPSTARRYREVKGLSLQRIDRAQEDLDRWFGVRLFDGLGRDEIDFLLRMFKKRNLLIHCDGRVDQKYLEATGDTSVKVNQTVRIGSSDVKRFLQLVDEVGSNLISQVASMCIRA